MSIHHHDDDDDDEQQQQQQQRRRHLLTECFNKWTQYVVICHQQVQQALQVQPLLPQPQQKPPIDQDDDGQVEIVPTNDLYMLIVCWKRLYLTKCFEVSI